MSPARFAPDLVHALHARRGGACAAPLARSLGVPYVITLTGTDATHDVGQPEHAAVTRGVIEGADALIALRATQLEELARAGVAVPPRAVVVPQGIALGAAPFDLRAHIGVGSTALLALLPGGLRPVKAQHVALAALEAVRRPGLDLHLVLAGPVLDPEYAELLRARAGGACDVHFVGALPHDVMGAAMSAADLVLNTSESEGESNAILEAQWAGRAVVARRNRGNAALVTHGVDGWLFDTPEELAALLTRLVGDEAARGAAGQSAAARVRPRADPGLEAARHLALYRAILGPSARPEGPDDPGTSHMRR